MAQEVPLPPPPRLYRRRSPTRQPTSARTRFQVSRRLSRVDDLSSQPASSDLALFSSDDIPDSGLENYERGADRKRRYRGTWWGEAAIDPKRKRTVFKGKRNTDSGIWMGSDESGTELCLSSEGVPDWKEDQARNTQKMSPTGRISGYKASLQVRKVLRAEEPENWRLSRAVVDDCLEQGNDIVDLGGKNLGSIPRGLLSPLQHLTLLPKREPPITDEAYSPFGPYIRLFLHGNALTELSSELFELSNLKVLSLWNNKLTEIPPAIRKLKELATINLTVNRLRYLPWELLWLVKNASLRFILVQSNPLLRIEDAEIAKWHLEFNSAVDSLEDAHHYSGIAPGCVWNPTHVATGPVQLLSMESVPLAKGPLGDLPPAEHRSRCPSLREVALATLVKSPSYSQIIESEELQHYPEMVRRLLWRAKNIWDEGGRVCSVCGRSYTVARAEWIEWWDCFTSEDWSRGSRAPLIKLRPLPFKRLGCSWGCLPEWIYLKV